MVQERAGWYQFAKVSLWSGRVSPGIKGNSFLVLCCVTAEFCMRDVPVVPFSEDFSERG